MGNILDEILTEVRSVRDRIEALEKRDQTEQANLTPLRQFCADRGISVPTAYAWEDRGLIQTKMIGGRRYVILSSVSVTSKYQRGEQQHNAVIVNTR